MFGGNMQGMMKKVQKMQKDMKKLQEELRTAASAKDEKEKQTASIEKQMEEFQSQAESGRSDIIQLLNDRSTIKERVQRYDTMLEQMEIRRSELSSRMLAMKGETTDEQDKLKKLEEEGLITRTVFAEVPLRVEYSLTEIGRQFDPVLDMIEKWGGEYIKYLHRKNGSYR